MSALHVLHFVALLCYVACVSNSRIARPLSLDVTPSKVQLLTPMYRFTKQISSSSLKDTGGSSIVIDLHSIVHVADKAYYQQLQQRILEYDVVLLELITSSSNIRIQDDSIYKKKLISNVFSLQGNTLANKFNLTSQLDMDLVGPSNVYIADLSSEQINALETRDSFKVFGRLLGSVFIGRTGDRLTLRQFFLADSFLTTSLRVLCWASPCPELSTLLIDWSRAQAGGIPDVVLPILSCIRSGQIDKARKIIFGQQLIGGLADSGDWGGAAGSNIEVRIQKRNEECVRVLKEVLKDELQTRNASSALTIAVMYGAYHIRDLTTRLQTLGFDLVAPPIKPLVAWDVSVTDASGAAGGPSYTQILLGSAAAAGYLLFGAVDWYFMLRLIIEGIRSSVENAAGADKSEIALAVIYFVTYVQRHSKLFDGASAVSVQWEQGLFDNV